MRIPRFLEDILEKVENELQRFTLMKSSQTYYSRYKSQKMEKQTNKKEEVRDVKRLKRDKYLNNTNNILRRVYSEFNVFPFKDKFKKFENEIGLNQLDYRFENGDIVKFVLLEEENKFEIKPYINNKYSNYRIKSKKLYNKLLDIYDFSETCTDRIKTKEMHSTGDPTRDRYNLILRKIQLRKEELSKPNLTQSKKEALENELKTYEKVAERLKKQLIL